MSSRISIASLSAWLIFGAGWLAQGVPCTAQLLDDFEDLSGWTPIVSEGADLKIVSREGKMGRAMGMDFDLSGVYGYVSAQKRFDITVPPDYQFTFDMRAEAPVNNFEFKLIDEEENVFWIKKLNITYPREWTKQRIKKRHLSFAWGPSRHEAIRRIRKIEFVVSVGTGGKGAVLVDNLRFVPIDTSAAASAIASVRASNLDGGNPPLIDWAGTLLENWRSSGREEPEWLIVDFGSQREVGGLVVEWDSVRYPAAYEIAFSDEGDQWYQAYRVSAGASGRHVIPLPDGEGRYLQILFPLGSAREGFHLRRAHFMGPEFAATPNGLFRSLAAEARPGLFPRYLLSRHSYWTVIGVSGDEREALMNEEGQIEVDKGQFSLEPFLYLGDTLVTWSDVTTTPSLLKGYLPIPTVSWNYQNRWRLSIEAVAAGPAGQSLLGLRYALTALGSGGPAKLLVAIRPFQVNPPWQALNIEGGVARIDSITHRGGLVHVGQKLVIPMTAPAAFGAVEFDQGEITDYLARGMVPANSTVHDHTGFASAALAYEFRLKAGETGETFLTVPFHHWEGSPQPEMSAGDARLFYQMMLAQAAGWWEGKLNAFRLILPPVAGDLEATLKSTLAYIFVNRDGPRIQPGSRSYERSWIRDGSLTCAALLRTGTLREVREFIDWYATGQFPSGKIPCVMDARGPDAVPEHDSHGQFIYAVHQYFLFSRDTAWLQEKYEAVVATVRYMQLLLAERRTETYRTGTPEQRALYGLVPESISHEGYWDVPRHSYWDDFFVLRGLKDAASIAGAVGDTLRERAFALEAERFRRDLYASIGQAMINTRIDYIPGCAELGDFDATSTTVGITPGGELGRIPEPQLHNTFDKYWASFSQREVSGYDKYTPYEIRTIGSFVYLGQKERAEHALAFFMRDRRPSAWNHWAEVVWSEPTTPQFIGDMPHTWVGSDFIRSVLTMFVLERERDSAHVLCAGIPDAWVKDSAGIQLAGLRTYHGDLAVRLRPQGRSIVVEVSGEFDARDHPLMLQAPLSATVTHILVNGRDVPVADEVRLPTLPVTVEFQY